MLSNRRLAAIAIAALGLCGCGPSVVQVAVRERAAYDLGCSERVEAFRSVGGSYVGRGCNKWALYTCTRQLGDVVCSKESGPFASTVTR